VHPGSASASPEAQQPRARLWAPPALGPSGSRSPRLLCCIAEPIRTKSPAAATNSFVAVGTGKDLGRFLAGRDTDRALACQSRIATLTRGRIGRGDAMDAVDDANAARQKRNAGSRVLTEARRPLHPVLCAQSARMRAGTRHDERRHQPLGGRAKRAFDVVLASAALALAAPIMLVAMALIRILTGGPVISAQPRIGFNGRAFSCYKLRTIARERQRTHNLRDYSQIEWLHYALRISGLDELPQLLNVLRGDMSFVGPHPIGPDEFGHSGSSGRWYLKARPGLTGIWQASGRSGDAARAACDRYYARRWSLWLDLVLLIRTVAEVRNFNDPA
jgi:exopolysaccharide production protein ExoY